MTTEPLPFIAGALLFLLAGAGAAATTRRLTVHPTPGNGQQHGAHRTLLWLLATTALAVGAAALWAGPGLDLSSTWPFAVALLIALAPLAVAATHHRRHTAHPAPDGRPAP